MNKIYKTNYGVRFFFVSMALILLMSACKKSVDQNPVITGVVNYVASPNDTALHSLVADGQWVVITGQHLQSAIQIKFNGITASFNATLFSNNSAVVQIPPMQFSTIDSSKLYTIEYTTTTGTTTSSFKLGPAAPVITAISNVFANPGDSVFLYGTNLVLVENLNYAGNPIAKTVSNLDGTVLGFIMPAQTPTDQVLLITKGGRDTFKIVATPTITGVSNCNASPGDSVYVYGTYLKGFDSFTFSGKNIISFVTKTDGSSVGFIMPAISSSGPVSITTPYGTAATAYDVNTQNNLWPGLLANFEWGDYFGYSWWGDITLASNVAVFNGSMGTNSSQYVYFNSPVLDGGASKYAPLGNSNTGNKWIPVANISDPVENWGLQFEISVADPWNGGTLYIRTEFAGDNFVARYEPWKIPGSNATIAYKTDGWQTVTIPLSEFRSKVVTLGDGESVLHLNQLLGPTGASSYNMTLKNFASFKTTTGFHAAIDNIRVVKIK